MIHGSAAVGRAISGSYGTHRPLRIMAASAAGPGGPPGTAEGRVSTGRIALCGPDTSHVLTEIAADFWSQELRFKGL